MTLEDLNNELVKILQEALPQKSIIDIAKDTEDSKQKIDNYNEKIIETYRKSEEEHIKQQKPVGIIIAIVVGIQLIAFNVLIYIVVLRSYELETLNAILNFMKYYTGAVIVEMLGLCLVIVKGVFNTNIGKVIEHIFKK